MHRRRKASPDPGEVVWTYVSYEDDPSQGKDRPVAVIGWDGPVLGVVQLTSKDHRRNDCVPIGTGDWDREHRPSFAKIDRILRVKPADVRREAPPCWPRIVSTTSSRHFGRCTAGRWTPMMTLDGSARRRAVRESPLPTQCLNGDLHVPWDRGRPGQSARRTACR